MPLLRTMNRKFFCSHLQLLLKETKKIPDISFKPKIQITGNPDSPNKNGFLTLKCFAAASGARRGIISGRNALRIQRRREELFGEVDLWRRVNLLRACTGHVDLLKEKLPDKKS